MRAILKLVVFGALMVFCCGGASMFYGWSEYRLGAKSTPDPVEVDLAKLEQGEKVENNHLKIGKHHACYWGSVYSYKKSKFSLRKPDASTKVTSSYYPIVSSSNPDVQLLEALLKKYGDLDNVPDDVDVPRPTHFVVLVKTTRFKTAGAIPFDIKPEPSIQGLVINEVSSLTSEEKKLIKDTFPNIDFNKVLILEDGRKPSSTAKAVVFMVMGAGILVVGLIGVIGLVVMMAKGQSSGSST
jgi:preprotein translocase subunit Sss1